MRKLVGYIKWLSGQYDEDIRAFSDGLRVFQTPEEAHRSSGQRTTALLDACGASEMVYQVFQDEYGRKTFRPMKLSDRALRAVALAIRNCLD